MRLTYVRMLALCIGAASMPTSVQAGAWTLQRHHWQVLTVATVTQADALFDGNGRARVPTKFNKELLQNTFEYGLTDRITLFATPAYVVASVQAPATETISAQNTSFEAGTRIGLFRNFGLLSLQGSYKSAGAFDLSVSSNRQPGRQIDVRLLYGRSFKLFDLNGFIDLQAGQRWISQPRPNETPVDLTAGLWLTSRTMLLAQSLNIISAGNGQAPYAYYRSHKVELSVVEKLSEGWSLKLGAFVSPTGQNALDERGISVALWTRN